MPLSYCRERRSRLGNERAPVELSHHPLARASTHSAANGGLFQQQHHRLGQRLRLFAGHEFASFSRAQGFRRPAGGSGNHGLATSLRLDKSDPESLEVPADSAIWERKYVALLVTLHQFVVA